MHSDPIADMLTRIRNGQAVRKETVVVPFCRVNSNILALIQEQGFIKKVETSNPRELTVHLKYKKDRTPKISHFKRVSKPGRRIYVNKNKLPQVLSNLGLAIISTHKGIMTNKQAKEQKLGGEVMCEIY